MTQGKVHSIQTLGTIDGPGVRFVVFLQGCNLRCSCCHNPDTWAMDGGTLYKPEEILQKVIRYKEYFGEEGGITVSGGEPLLQAEFVKELFRLCHTEGINTCLDTSGSILNDSVKQMLEETDRVLLDMKYTTGEDYRMFVGCDIDVITEFLSYLDEKKIPVTLRQVVIPTVNNTEENILKLKYIRNKYSCIDKVELLPFRKICQVKYDKMGIDFPFGILREATKDDIDRLYELLK